MRLRICGLFINIERSVSGLLVRLLMAGEFIMLRIISGLLIRFRCISWKEEAPTPGTKPPRGDLPFPNPLEDEELVGVGVAPNGAAVGDDREALDALPTFDRKLLMRCTTSPSSIP